MSSDYKKEISGIIDELLSAGWRIRQCGSQHYQMLPPDPTKNIVMLAATPSDHRAIKNVKSYIRRAGYPIK